MKAITLQPLSRELLAELSTRPDPFQQLLDKHPGMAEEVNAAALAQSYGDRKDYL